MRSTVSRAVSRAALAPPPARHAIRPGRSGRAIARLAAVTIAVVAVSATAVTGVAVAETVTSIKPGIHLAQLPGASPVPTVGAIDGEVNLLLVGTDTRSDQGGDFSDADNQAASSGAGSNDVTMLLHISADHTNATVVSFPRDLMVPVPECPDPDGGTVPASDEAMFNTTLSEGGLSCVVRTVESLTGLTGTNGHAGIDYAAEISFDGVIAMSNAVGGVSVCLATPVDDDDAGLHLPAGQQTLEGADALAFVRSRHGVGDGSDLGRISNQQLFLSALMRQISSAGVLSNPVTLYSLANAALKNMQLSDTLSNLTTPVAIAVALKNVSLNNMVFVQYPVASDPDDSNRVVPDDDADATLNDALQSDQPVTLTGGVGRAAVLDPSVPTDAAAPDASSPDASSPDATAAPPSDTTGDPATSTPTPTAVSLPSDVSGQTAAQATCTEGNN